MKVPHAEIRSAGVIIEVSTASAFGRVFMGMSGHIANLPDRSQL
jgi:hypothetical protein